MIPIEDVKKYKAYALCRINNDMPKNEWKFYGFAISILDKLIAGNLAELDKELIVDELFKIEEQYPNGATHRYVADRLMKRLAGEIKEVER